MVGVRASLAVLALLAFPPSAAAHGPCDCISRAVAEPGDRLLAGPAYRVIWNPAARDFADQTTPVALASGYREDAPTVERRVRSVERRLAFRVPRRTPPGIYLVLVFDGSEAGFHTTWDYVQVPGRATAQPAGRLTGGRTRPPVSGRGTERALVAIAIAIAAALGGALLVRRRAGGR